MQNRIAIITGAGRGIGRAIALAYAREGARLALAPRTVTELEETAQQAEALGAETCVIPTDVTDQAQVDAMVGRTPDRYSTIDILVNNAGIGGPIGAFQDNDVSHWIDTIQVNLIGVYLICQAVLPVMLSQNRGKIINMAGVGGHRESAYGVSKAGLVSLTEILYQGLEGKDIQVNAMSPGSIHTAMWEEVRDAAMALGDTELYEQAVQITSGGGASIERAAEMAVFLASDASGSLSGRLLHETDDFDALAARLPDIMASDTYMMRRVGFA